MPRGLRFNAEETARLYDIDASYEDNTLVVTDNSNTIRYTWLESKNTLSISINGDEGI